MPTESPRPEAKLIKCRVCPVSLIDLPDDPSYPFKLEIHFRQPPGLVQTIFNLLDDEEQEIIFRGMSKEVLDKILDLLCYRIHPRLKYFLITGPDGVVELYSNDN